MAQERGLRLWDEEIDKIIDDKRNAVKRYTATRSHEDKTEYNGEKHDSQKRNKKETQIKLG